MPEIKNPDTGKIPDKIKMPDKDAKGSQESIMTSAFIEAVTSHSRRQDFCDITVQVEGQEFRLHSFLLSIWSEFFRALLNSNMKEVQDRHITLGNITAETFQTVLDCILQLKLDLTTENVTSVWRAADMLVIDPLTQACQQFAMDNVSVDNCADIYFTSKQLCSQRCASEVWTFIVDNFDDVVKNEQSLEFSYDEVKSLVSEDLLRTSSEDKVIEFVVRWCFTSDDDDVSKYCVDADSYPSESDLINGNTTKEEQDRDSIDHGYSSDECAYERVYERAGFLQSLLCKCRLDLASSKCLMQALNHPDMSKSPDARATLMAAVERQFQGCSRYQVSSIWSQHRHHDSMGNGVLWFKKSGCVMWSSMEKIRGLVESENCNNVLRGTRIGRLINNDVICATVMKENVFIVTSSLELHRFSTDSLQLDKISGAIIINNNVSICAAGNHVFISGNGVSEKSVIHTDGTIVHLFPSPITVINLQPFESQLIITGHSNNSSNKTSVYTVDHFLQDQVFVGDIPESAKRMVTFRTHDEIFFLFHNGALWKLGRSNDDVESLFRLSYVSHVWQSKRAVSWANVVDNQLLVFLKNPFSDTSSNFAKVDGVFESIKFVMADSKSFLSSSFTKQVVDLSFFEEFSEKMSMPDVDTLY